MLRLIIQKTSFFLPQSNGRDSKEGKLISMCLIFLKDKPSLKVLHKLCLRSKRVPYPVLNDRNSEFSSPMKTFEGEAGCIRPKMEK